jgi:type I restriction enzyme M protein
VSARIAELEEEHGGEDGVFSDFEKVNKTSVAARVKETEGECEFVDEGLVLNSWLKMNALESDLKKRIKGREAGLDGAVYAKYPLLSQGEVTNLVVNDKWLNTLNDVIGASVQRKSEFLSLRLEVVVNRYANSLARLLVHMGQLESKVLGHIESFGVPSN